jgi:voltage-gated potassium channel Kch
MCPCLYFLQHFASASESADAMPMSPPPSMRAQMPADAFPVALPRLLESAHHLQGHVILCGPGIHSHLSTVLEPLCHLSRSPIVVLAPLSSYGADISVTTILSDMGLDGHLTENVYFVDGKCVNHQDLERAGIARAAVAAVIATSSEPGSEDAVSALDLGDVGSSSVPSEAEMEALFSVCVIEAQFPQCRVLLEVVDAGAMKYLLHKPNDDSLARQLWPQYASGRTFVSSSLSNLLVQAYYNDSLIPVLCKLIDPFGKIVKTQQVISPVDEGYVDLARRKTIRRNSLFSAGARRASLLAATVHAKPEDSRLGHPENNHLVQMKVPHVFVGCRYGDLFSELVLTKGMVLLGLYRSASVHTAPLPYIVTNPSAKLKLHAEDLLLVLCGDRVMAAAASNATL